MTDVLSAIDAPTDVTVLVEFDGTSIRFDHERTRLVRSSLWVMLATWGLWGLAGFMVFSFSAGIRDLLLTLLLIGFAGTLVIPLVGYALEELIAGWTVRSLVLGPHQIRGVGVNGGALPTWNVHDLQEVWVARDWWSPVVAIRRRSGVVSALRVDQLSTAHWLANGLESWRQERATEPTEEAQRLQQAMRARVGQPS